MPLQYSYSKTTNTLRLVVRNNNRPVWSVAYPSFFENASDGELMEDPTLIEMGVMKSLEDVDGLKKYLVEQNIVQPSDAIEKK